MEINAKIRVNEADLAVVRSRKVCGKCVVERDYGELLEGTIIVASRGYEYEVGKSPIITLRNKLSSMCDYTLQMQSIKFKMLITQARKGNTMDKMMKDEFGDDDGSSDEDEEDSYGERSDCSDEPRRKMRR